jgi:predicted Zn-dependent protease
MAVVALIVAAWFGLGVRQAHQEQVAAGIADNFKLLAPEQIAAAQRAIDRAGTLNPDAHIDVLRAEIALHRRDRRTAAAILDDVVAREPQDIEAWALLAGTLRGHDPAGAARARVEVLRLAPPVPAP